MNRRITGRPLTSRDDRRWLTLLSSLCLVLGSITVLAHDATHMIPDPTCVICTTAHEPTAVLPSAPVLLAATPTDEAPWRSLAVAIIRVDLISASARAPPVIS